MKKFLPVLISICAVSCINACDDSQKVVQGSHDDSLPNVKMEVHIDDVKQGEVNVQDMADFVQSVTASGETSNAIAISDFIQQINNVPDNELDAYLAQYLCDYQSYADNMRPTDKGEKCAMVSCTEAKRSYYNVESENLFYADDAPMKAGCYRVKNLGKILMYKANPNSAVVWVYTIDDQGKEKSIDIDLDIMEAKTQVGGSDAVKLSISNAPYSVNSRSFYKLLHTPPQKPRHFPIINSTNILLSSPSWFSTSASIYLAFCSFSRMLGSPPAPSAAYSSTICRCGHFHLPRGE